MCSRVSVRTDCTRSNPPIATTGLDRGERTDAASAAMPGSCTSDLRVWFISALPALNRTTRTSCEKVALVSTIRTNPTAKMRVESTTSGGAQEPRIAEYTRVDMGVLAQPLKELPKNRAYRNCSCNRSKGNVRCCNHGGVSNWGVFDQFIRCNESYSVQPSPRKVHILVSSYSFLAGGCSR